MSREQRLEWPQRDSLNNWEVFCGLAMQVGEGLGDGRNSHVVSQDESSLPLWTWEAGRTPLASVLLCIRNTGKKQVLQGLQAPQGLEELSGWRDACCVSMTT